MSALHARRVAEGFSFPTSVAFDARGTPYVAESGLPFGGAPPGGRVWRLGTSGRELVVGGLPAPVNGLAFHDDGLYVSEGGHPARITRVDAAGGRATILDGLPGPGNYHTNMTAFGPDGKLYFSQGAMTNTGIVGLDSYEMGWLRRLPHAHDIPGYDVTLTGVAVETDDPLSRNGRVRAKTGAFAPFGVAPSAGQRIAGRVPCTAAMLRCEPDGTGLELVAWGLRNAYGLGFLRDGRLLAIDQGADDRGSRPVGDAPDLLFEVKRGAWYGWPDFVGGVAVTDPRFHPSRGPRPAFLLANHHELPTPQGPLLSFPPHACAVKFDALPLDHADWPGQVLVALFGDERPLTAPDGPRVGRSVARIDPSDWSLHPVDVGPFVRPIDVRFNAADGHAYVLDFGRFEMGPRGRVDAEPATGTLWRLE